MLLKWSDGRTKATFKDDVGVECTIAFYWDHLTIEEGNGGLPMMDREMAVEIGGVMQQWGRTGTPGPIEQDTAQPSWSAVTPGWSQDGLGDNQFSFVDSEGGDSRISQYSHDKIILDCHDKAFTVPLWLTPEIAAVIGPILMHYGRTRTLEPPAKVEEPVGPACCCRFPSRDVFASMMAEAFVMLDGLDEAHDELEEVCGPGHEAVSIAALLDGCCVPVGDRLRRLEDLQDAAEAAYRIDTDNWLKVWDRLEAAERRCGVAERKAEHLEGFVREQFDFIESQLGAATAVVERVEPILSSLRDDVMDRIAALEGRKPPSIPDDLDALLEQAGELNRQYPVGTVVTFYRDDRPWLRWFGPIQQPFSVHTDARIGSRCVLAWVGGPFGGSVPALNITRA